MIHVVDGCLHPQDACYKQVVATKKIYMTVRIPPELRDLYREAGSHLGDRAKSFVATAAISDFISKSKDDQNLRIREAMAADAPGVDIGELVKRMANLTAPSPTPLESALAANDYGAVLDALDALGVDRAKLREAMDKDDAPPLPLKRPPIPNIPGVGRANELKRVASTDRHDDRSVDDVKQGHAKKRKG